MNHYEKSKLSSDNQLTSYVFRYRKLIRIQAGMAQSQTNKNNENTFFNLLPGANQLSSNNDEKQNSNNGNMDQVKQQQSIPS